ncbi:putative autophagy ubiquitin-activating enzyme ApgG [Aspergillus fumigatus Af293]|uniref:Ubiquitin-like modifier-activating enzyme ATG7 n=2 Tax=Aspergillus fumigatus TaxID=746128 RepID=Q4WH89_ASPFU|nr:autophagy ubiquitin-activating enzyme ApgG, putative [Aspergillus fumigatus Af293]EAL87716.1 autophagy ubiquitin-activating enzyme ApgG, putative [Aspergillus fumigatus Af293]EDP54277.1 autophagy ubiquitin-activating enzyme ApgG, putative [Aspergillus fumigatus A1163]
MQYAPFASDIELPFYTALATLKIDRDKLDDSARKVLGLYEVRSTDAPKNSCRMQIHGNALTSDEAEGSIKNFNTCEEYRDIDKPQMLQQAGQTILDAIEDGSIYLCPSKLSYFMILSFADLKKYKFHYWFAFPALHSTPSWTPVPYSEEIVGDTPVEPINRSPFKALSTLESSTLVEAVQTWSRSVEACQRGFFLARKYPKLDGRPEHDSKEMTKIADGTLVASSQQSAGHNWEIASLASYESGFFDGVPFEDSFICFADPSNYDDAPGWMLRNLLFLIKQRWGLRRAQILRYRDTRCENGRSMVVTMECKGQLVSRPGSFPETVSGAPKVTGWERNSAGKLSGRLVDLTEYLNPKRLADQSVDLNLKLMKWRISPDLDLEKIKRTRCLLLGAGTLGSYVARNLMAWGVTKITFVDNGNVSFSNPVRQSLFNFKDCLEGGARKATRAAQALSEIYPGVETTGHVLSVPMAGHPITDTEKTRKEFGILKALVDDHDVIFLLMDTRESRWLPTVIGKAAGKIVINAALGFDSFVVMRHGVRNDADPTSELGCYFCNDVVAPMNSVRDQTLDQQCTVTRPGVATIASALAVELLISLLQHPQGAAAPAALPGDDRGSHPLGLVPHQIRGFLSSFENISVIGRSYDCCSACSINVVNAYNEQGWEFVMKALNEPGYVEELSGLREVSRNKPLLTYPVFLVFHFPCPRQITQPQPEISGTGHKQGNFS